MAKKSTNNLHNIVRGQYITATMNVVYLRLNVKHILGLLQVLTSCVWL